VAQIFNPVSWETSLQHIADDEYLLTYSATIEKGWSVYSQFLESEDGPVATTITYEELEGSTLLEDALETGHRKEGFDPIFEMNVVKFADEFTIKQRLKATPGKQIKGYLTYMTCDDTRCLPPTDVEFDFIVPAPAKIESGNNDGAAADIDPNKPADDLAVVEDIAADELSISFDEVDLTDAVMGQGSENSIFDPVKWSAHFLPGSSTQVEFVAKIDDGWNIYDQEIEGDDIPIPTEFYFDGEHQVLPMESNHVVEEKDQFFGGILIKKIKKEASYLYTIKGQEPISGEITYMACDIERCINPMPVTFTIDPQGPSISIGEASSEEEDLSAISGTYPIPPIDLDNPVGQCGDETLSSVNSSSLLGILLLGFFGGLLALLTPCVFPMIPLTVSFFTKGSENRQKGLRKAVLFGFFILLVYLLLSIPFHLLDSVNPGILNDISTNVGLNIAFFLIFLFFAFSFFGYYELTVPSKWTNKVSNAESVGGVLGVFFMALTLALVSFSCTGPILGTLLAGALTSEGGAMQLTVGMGGFGLALALPFAIFAAFPTMLGSLPKSGGWLNTVKVVLGFLELALAFKFLSNADLVKHWGLLKLEPFLIIWIVIAIGLAIYLFGKWKFPHDSPIKKLSAIRVAGGVLSIAFAVYLATGFTYDYDKKSFKPLSLLSGLAPPVGYSWIYPKDCPNDLDCFKDLDEGIAYAKKVDKPIMLDFTGYACVNCRKMEEHVWPIEGVNNRLKEDYVLISLYVDEKVELPEDEKTERFQSYGRKWQAFQTEYFNNNSQPYYVLISPEGKLLNNPVGYTPDALEYSAFLDCGLSAFKEIRGDQLGSN